jgi:hypothetical protein
VNILKNEFREELILLRTASSNNTGLLKKTLSIDIRADFYPLMHLVTPSALTFCPQRNFIFSYNTLSILLENNLDAMVLAK